MIALFSRFLLCAAFLPSCCHSFCTRPPNKRRTARTEHWASQLLEFQEPTTGVTVKLVGAMHYNPTSIQLAAATIQSLGKDDKLGSVVIESCDIRWNTTLEMNPALQKALNSEMRIAHDLAMEYQRPVVLGDQRINITVSRLGSGLKETLLDVVNPIRWKRVAQTIGTARKEALPFGDDDKYLTAFAFFEPKLLLASPVSFLKYPMSYFVKSPILTAVFFMLLFLGDQGAMPVDEMTLTDWTISFVGAFLETVVFARVFLKELLAERNEILARNILEQCKLYQSSSRQPFWRRRVTTTNSEIVYAPGSVNAQPAEDKAVVAVLGMAHCNGIMKLLKDQKV